MMIYLNDDLAKKLKKKAKKDNGRQLSAYLERLLKKGKK